MPDSITKNYSWVKPEVHASPTTWGDKLNSDLDLIDAQVKTNSDAIASAGTIIGQIIMWPGVTPPTNWWWCAGDVISRTDFASLFGILGTAFGAGDGSTTFNLPDLRGRVPVGFGAGQPISAIGGEATHTLTNAELATHVHGVNDPGHVHGVVDPGHTHNISQSPHAHGVSDPGHTHTFTNTVSGGSGIGLGSGISLQSGNTGSATTGIGIQGANANIGIVGSASGVSIGGAATGISLTADGGGQPHNNLQPYMVLGFIIRLL
jgi:microcystin-dependent protein